MKEKIILILLIISLVLNISIIGTLIIKRNNFRQLREHQLPAEFEKMHLDKNQRISMKNIAEDFQMKNDSLINEIGKKRNELSELLREDKIDTQRITNLIDDISIIQAQTEKRMVLNIVEIKSILTPEQYEIMIHSLGKKPGMPGKPFNEPKYQGGPQ